MPRRIASPHAVAACTRILANGAYAVMVTAAGSGYSRWRNLDITRWREDATRDDWGSYILLRDMQSGAVWSATAQPLGGGADHEETHFAEHIACFARRDGTLTTTLEIAIDPHHDAEVRGVALRNEGSKSREIELTSYAELVLGATAADASHPAFSKMFVRTEFVGSGGVLLATRRKRDPSEPNVWAAHGMVIDGKPLGALEYETDRARFIGRDRSLREPRALDAGQRLSGTAGTVLDPIFSLRRRVRVAPGATVRIAWVTAAAGSRGAALALARRYDNPAACERVYRDAARQSAKTLQRLGVDADQAKRFQRLAGALLYADPVLRADPAVLEKGEGGAPVLWSRGISGDLPIALLRIGAAEQLALVRQLVRAQRYWREKHLPADLVILNEVGGGQAEPLQRTLQAAVSAASGKNGDTSQGGTFVLRGDQLDARLRNGLLTAARVVLFGRDGDLAAQLRRAQPAVTPHVRSPSARRPILARPAPASAAPPLEFFNGLGGFSADGREYVTVLRGGQSTPMPWTHVVANPDFGFLATTTGGGYCWSLNSQQNAITPWSNDAVVDPPGEMLYLRDEDDGALWSATASPIRVPATAYTSRFGPGYAKFEHTAHGIETGLLQFVPLSDPLKISRLTLRNRSERTRRLSITAYAEWALGAIGTHAAPFVVTSVDGQTGALFARNAWRDEFGGRIAFADLRGRQASCTGDRGEFLGYCGSPVNPTALADTGPLSGRTGAGLDPCAALQTRITLEPGASAEIVFLLGEGADEDAARALVARYRAIDLDATRAEIEGLWADVLGSVQVRTPEPSMDLLLNRCLLYQTLACRLWARTAFYQASGAYGFRDQLQDVMALCVARPDLAREHLLRSAARQFIEGDVQHWWLPPGGKGVRTRVSDDRIWLPYVVAYYIETTGDTRVLDEVLPFLDGDPLKPGQTDAFFKPTISTQTGTLFEHCARALEVSMDLGAHGLPLIGSGDWNDGMNRVGSAGKGESTWLGWFLHATLAAFAPLAEARGERGRAANWRAHAQKLVEAIEDKAWDGAWYLRAYYDDGTPLGSRHDTECRIDSIAQSWSVISGAGDPARAARAMHSVDEHLVRPEDGLVALFTAPFDRTRHDPGYIKGYPPGLRENGGQYTHGSIWSAIAFALLGEGDKAFELFRIFDPILHSDTSARVERYKVEPYVSCADVYSVAPHVGRGGWTWYSGSAGWLYRAGLETLLGFHLRGASLRIDPCIPKTWPRFAITFRYHSARYTIAVENPHGVCRGVVSIELDGSALKDVHVAIPLADDGAQHHIRIALGEP